MKIYAKYQCRPSHPDEWRNFVNCVRRDAQHAPALGPTLQEWACPAFKSRLPLISLNGST